MRRGQVDESSEKLEEAWSLALRSRAQKAEQQRGGKSIYRKKREKPPAKGYLSGKFRGTGNTPASFLRRGRQNRDERAKQLCTGDGIEARN